MNSQKAMFHLATALGLAIGLIIVFMIGFAFIPVSYAAPVRPPLGRMVPLQDTFISDDIINDTIWTAANSPYIIMTDTIAIRNGATLTIEPGVEIRFANNAQLQIVDGARVYAVGTSANRITFTSNATTPGPARGDWLGIIVDDTAQSCTFEYTVIAYASTGINIGVQLGVTDTIRHNIFHDNGDGITGGAIYGSPDGSNISQNVVYDCSAGFTFNKAFANTIYGNTFYDIDSYGIWFARGLSTGGDQNEISENEIYNCGSAGIRLEGGDLNQITNNEIYGNGESGIWLEDGLYNFIGDNDIHDNAGEGILASQQRDLEIRGNEISANATSTGAAAIHIVDSQQDIDVVDNWLHGNGRGAGYVATLFVETPTTALDTLTISDNVLCDSYGDGIEYEASHNNGTFAIGGNAICSASCYAGRFAFDNNSLNNISIEGNWWGTNSPTNSIFDGLVDFDPWIVFAAANTTPPPYPPDGVTPIPIAISMIGGGQTVSGVARDITVETSDSHFAGGGTVINTTLDGSGQAIVSLIAPSFCGTVVLTATDYCGTVITLLVSFEGPDLTIAKTAGSAQVEPGGTIVYTLDFENLSGITAQNVEIRDTLPPGTTFDSVVSMTPGLSGPTQVGNELIWTIASLPVGSPGTIVFAVHVDSAASCGAMLTNNVTIDSTTGDCNPADNADSAQVQVVGADLTIAKTTASAQVGPGGIIVYTLDFANQSGITAQTVTISDTLPPGVTFDS
ncbi:MAG: right-handed parallel beta-helix repeat-containing protein, partial [Anaerolineae bacterium]|nr:right-handed parallel beta-helix repeat-containing protein [Anaerolineae bacterium]